MNQSVEVAAVSPEWAWLNALSMVAHEFSQRRINFVTSFMFWKMTNLMRMNILTSGFPKWTPLIANLWRNLWVISHRSIMFVSSVMCTRVKKNTMDKGIFQYSSNKYVFGCYFESNISPSSSQAWTDFTVSFSNCSRHLNLGLGQGNLKTQFPCLLVECLESHYQNLQGLWRDYCIIRKNLKWSQFRFDY